MNLLPYVLLLIAGNVNAQDEEACQNDPALHFPFADDANDMSCRKVQGELHGDAYVDPELGALVLDGDGDFMSFAFLNQFIEDTNPTDLSVCFWFKSNTPTTPIRGMFGYGNDDVEGGMWMGFGNDLVMGGVTTEGGTAFFGPYGPDTSDRFIPPRVQPYWLHMAIRYTTEEVTFFINSRKKATRPISGALRTLSAAATIGLAMQDCKENYFSGLIDELMVFDRYVDDQEMSWDVFGRGRTNGLWAVPYKRSM